MTRTHRLALVACLAVAPLVAACDSQRPAPSQSADQAADGEPRTALARTINEALEEARKEIATENISIGGHTDIHIGGASISSRKPVDADGNPLPDAEISPAGDLLIAGKPVDITPAQRELLLEYRGHVAGLIETGMAIGVKGADLGIQAAGEALKSVFSGETADLEQRVEAEAAKLEAEAMKLCDRLPAMLQTQQQLAETLPEFRPYATLEADDIDDCHRNDGSNAARRAEVQSEIRQAIRSTIRGSVQTAAQASGVAEGGTTDDAAATDETSEP